MPAFELAVRQRAGCIEHDVQVTRDGVLVCLHDRTLERTTDVREKFPDRGRIVVESDRPTARWFVNDFTLPEVRQLDAGRWFGPEFAGAAIPTFDELLEWARTRVAILTELKDPEAYEPIGVDMLQLFEAAVRRHTVTRGSLTVQSFHEPTVRRAGTLVSASVPVALLVDESNRQRLSTREHIMHVAAFASGIGPAKSIVAEQPAIVEWAHGAGLRVTPWTFQSAAAGAFESVGADMRHHLFDLGVDAVITDHPDACP